MATSLGVIGDVSNTCETAEYFFNEQVKHRIAKFESDVNVVMQNSDYKITVEMLFPFKLYFSDIPGQLFHGL